MAKTMIGLVDKVGASVTWSSGKLLIPEHGTGQAQVEVQAIGICGPVLHSHHPDIAIPMSLPVVTSRGFSATVARAGDGVQQHATIGDRIFPVTSSHPRTG